MSITNDFQAFAIAGGANVESQATYLADPALGAGQQPGVAASALNNKVLRQATFPVSQLMQYVGNKSNTNMNDNAVPAQLLAQIFAVLDNVPPVITKYTSSTGTWQPTYNFHCAAFTISPTAGATYTDSNSTTFTVSVTATGVVLQATGGTYPAASGTLTKTDGTGDATVTYYAVRAPLYLKVKMVGGGGGGGGTGGGSPTNGGSGGNTTFGTSFLTANGGGGGVVAGNCNNGGTATIAAGAVGINIQGSTGICAGSAASSGSGGAGGSSAFGGVGTGGIPGIAIVASAASTNSGSGGGGAGLVSGSGAGGGASGGYIEAFITLALGTTASYAYAVGAAGAAGTGTNAGGAGGSGVVYVEAHYQ